jgi:cell division protein FtsQ
VRARGDGCLLTGTDPLAPGLRGPSPAALAAAASSRFAGRGDVTVERPRGGIFRRRRTNRRISFQSRYPIVWLAGVGEAAWRAGVRVGRPACKLALLAAVIVACAWGGRLGLRHVVDSPRFQLRTVEYAPTPHLGKADLLALAGVTVGASLLSIDTDAVALRIASHPWVERVHASRRLPGCLVIEVSERQAAAVVALSGLYLVDESGRPFKRASMDEADGLPVITGIERARYASMREVSEAAFREALALLGEYRDRPGRPAVGEISIDPGFGFSLLLFEGGAEIRLGRGNYGKKLAQLDEIFEALGARGTGGLSALRIVHLDLPESGRVPVLLRGGGKPFAPSRSVPVKIAKNESQR